jgi:putative ABC transport system permease protein
MKLRTLFKIAYRSLSKNKLRSFLTMLGIIIGVASVVAMLSIGEGSKDNIQKQIQGMGTNMIIVIPGSFTTGGVRLEAGSSSKLTYEDGVEILSNCPSVQFVSPVVRATGQLIAGSQNWRTSVMGVNADYFKVRNLGVVKGEMFSKTDERTAAKVCLLGQTVIKNLYGENVDPTGLNLRINSIPYKIIGVLEKKGQNAMGMDQDDIVVAPFYTVQKRMLSTTNVSQILVSAHTETLIPSATDEISELIRQRHKLTPSEADDFTLRTQTQIGDMFKSTSTVLTVLLASIASISLIVGGIGIMNIMFVSVTERTREVGIRMAVGARSNDVLLQFLIEAIFLSFIGGIIGVGLGLAASGIVSGMMKWPIMISVNAIVLSFICSTATGIFFGWYPARKAANLNPIEALRFE